MTQGIPTAKRPAGKGPRTKRKARAAEAKRVAAVEWRF